MRNSRNGNRSNRQNGMGNVTPTVIAFAAGAVAGAVTALLLAPQAGAETRRSLGDMYDKAKEGISEYTSWGSEEEENEFSEPAATGRRSSGYSAGKTSQGSMSSGSMPGSMGRTPSGNASNL